RPRLAHPARARTVHEDAEDPRLQRRAPIERVQSTDHGEPRVLDDLLRDRFAAHARSRDEPQRAVVACDERREGGLVPGSQASEQLGLVGSQGATLPQAAGAMLWLRRKALSGSYCALIRPSRARLRPSAVSAPTSGAAPSRPLKLR